MTGDSFLYPLLPELGYSIWGWRTRSRLAISIFLTCYFFSQKKGSERKNVLTASTNIVSIHDEIVELEKSIGNIATQDRYRSFQILVREYVKGTYGVDIDSTTLAELKVSYSDLPSILIDLLGQTYYFPYNKQVGEVSIMKKHADQFLHLLEG